MRVDVQTSPTFTTSAPVPVLERTYVWNAVGPLRADVRRVVRRPAIPHDQGCGDADQRQRA